MTQFTASNGLIVEPDMVGGVGVTWASPKNAGWTFLGADEALALREFFAADRSE
jgi:hypothetical protein